MRRTWAAVPILLAGSLATFFLFRSDADRRDSAPRKRVACGSREYEEGAAPGIAAAPSVRLRYRFRAGDFLEYRFRSDQATTLAVRGGGDSRTLQSGMAGILHIAVHEASSAGYLFGYRFTDASVRMEAEGATGDEGAMRRIEREMTLETLVAACPRGRVSEFRFPKSMGAPARNLIKNVVHQAALILPIDEANAWTEQEVDSTGRYVARYDREAPEGERTPVRRRKESYSELWVAGSEKARCLVTTEGGTRALFDANGHWKSIDVDERLRLEGVDFTQDVRVVYRGRYELTHRGTGPVGGIALDTERSAPGGFEGGVEPVRDRSRSLAAGATVEGLLADLARFAVGSREAYDAWEQLTALLTVDESAVARALDLLRTCSPDVQAALAGALGSAGTPVAQRALARILADDALDGGTRESALVALTMTPNPTEESESCLKERAPGDPAAAVGLGVYARSLAATDAARSDRIVDLLREMDGRAGDPQQIRAALDALGNSGSAGAFETVLRRTREDDPEIRATAVFALRFMPDSSVDERLGGFLDDPSPQVQAAASEALTFRSGPKADAAMRRAATHASEAVRRQAVAYFADRADGLEIVRRMAAVDPSSEIRTLAAQALARDP